MQGGELALRAEMSSPLDVLRSATSINAEILRKSGELGCIKPGAYADLLLVNGDPLADLSLFSRPEQSLALIMKGGRVVKHAL
jgi:imidazolonepropionase-like amidohydrolase